MFKRGPPSVSDTAVAGCVPVGQVSPPVAIPLRTTLQKENPNDTSEGRFHPEQRQTGPVADTAGQIYHQAQGQPGCGTQSGGNGYVSHDPHARFSYLAPAFRRGTGDLAGEQRWRELRAPAVLE